MPDTTKPAKLNAHLALDGIVGVIHDHLAKHDAFSSNSLCYYGVSFEYTLNIKLVSRGETELEVHGQTAIGDENTHPLEVQAAVSQAALDQDSTAEGTAEIAGEPVKVTAVEIKGARSTGKHPAHSVQRK